MRALAAAWGGTSPALLALAAMLAGMAPAAAQQDGPGLQPLVTSRAADPVNGRRIVADRRKGLCLLCHSGPFPEERFQGDLAPTLAGVGARLNEAALRLRLANSRLINPHSIMPAYFRADGLVRVAGPFRGKTLLTAEEIEDVVSFLLTLKE